MTAKKITKREVAKKITSAMEALRMMQRCLARGGDRKAWDAGTAASRPQTAAESQAWYDDAFSWSQVVEMRSRQARLWMQEYFTQEGIR